LVGTILVDEDGIYDPRHPNDRLLLGMKGTMSELELSLFRQRSQEALRQMARRGALVLGVAAGYVKVGRDRIEKNPDKRVQQAIQLVFTKFAEPTERRVLTRVIEDIFRDYAGQTLLTPVQCRVTEADFLRPQQLESECGFNPSESKVLYVCGLPGIGEGRFHVIDVVSLEPPKNSKLGREAPT